MHACLYICTFVDMETGFQQLHILYTVLLTWKQVFSCYTYTVLLTWKQDFSCYTNTLLSTWKQVSSWNYLVQDCGVRLHQL